MNTIVVSFASADDARGAADTLRTNGFHHVAVSRLRAVRRSAPEIRESGLRPERALFVIGDGDTLAARLGRMLSGGGMGRAVYDVLTRAGLSDREAREAEPLLPDNGALITVESDGHRNRLREVIASAGGEIIGGVPMLPVVYDDFIIVSAAPAENTKFGGAAIEREAGTNPA